MYTLKTIVQKIEVLRSTLHQDERIEYFLTDSRSLMHPEQTLFFAIRTITGDGHRYIQQLYEHGVRNFVVRDDYEGLVQRFPDANFIEVRDVIRALQRIAASWRREFAIPVIGITGSNGKTIVKEFLYQLLSPSYRIVRSPRSYNSQLGVPLSILKMTQEDQLAIFEAGISQLGEMNRIESIIKPTIGIFTSIGSAHQENFSSIAQKVDEKLRLFKGCQQIVFNQDEAEVWAGIQRMGLSEKAYSWSKKDPQATLWARRIETGENSTLIAFSIRGEDFEVEIPFTDRASIDNVITSLLTLSLIDPAVLKESERFRSLEPIEMRLELVEGSKGNLVVNDVYNNDINSLKIALDFLQQRAKSEQLFPVLILTEIQQSALNERSLYLKIGELIGQYPIEKFYGIGKNLNTYREFFPPEIAHKDFFASVEELLASDTLTTLQNACILIKGARSFQCERIVDRLSRKIHETTLEVDLEVIAQNLQHYRAMLPPQTRFIGMVKAEGYGIGAYEVAKTLDQAHIDALAVAVADEGMELRREGILTPILVMNPETSAFDTLLEWHLEPVVFSWDLLRALEHKVSNLGFNHVGVHIEVDTGMHRLGFRPEELPRLAEFFCNNHLLHVQSIFTHLAAADDPKEDEFTLAQLNTFRKSAEAFAQQVGYKPYFHALNTAGIERFPQFAMDAVRLGIGLYGISPSGVSQIKSAVKLRTSLLQVSQVRPEETIGYGRHGRLPQGGTIGIIPIGYADGYDRRMSKGNGWVVIRGKRCPIIGNVCMDSCMVDLTDCPMAEPGDEAILFGTDDVRIEDLAKAIDTIPYELIADLAPRVRRVYYQY